MEKSLHDQRRHLKIVKHSVRIAGHPTSISLEEAFWLELKKLAQKRGYPLSKLIREIDAKRSGNLSSALRVWILQETKKQNES